MLLYYFCLLFLNRYEYNNRSFFGRLNVKFAFFLIFQLNLATIVVIIIRNMMFLFQFF